MQPTTPDPSSEQPSQDAPAAPEQSSEPVEQSRGSWFLQRLWRGRNGGSTEDSDQGAETPGQQTSPPITLTQEELDRRIQAETDRREAKRANERQQADRVAERRRLRDEDPWAYAEQDRQTEQQVMSEATVSNMFTSIGSTHDRFTLDPLVEQLPEAERQRIMSLPGAGVGLDGRKLIVQEGLRALEKHWKEEGAKDAEAKLRRNPAFRKQVFGEMRRGAPEPDFISGGAPSEADRSVSNLLRAQLNNHRSM